MIAAWMLHAAAAALLLALAAAGADRLLRLSGRPTRWAWAAALLGSILVPAGAWTLARRAAAAPAAQPVEPASANGVLPGALSLDELLARATVVVEPASPLAALDLPLLALWLAASIAVAAWLLVGLWRLRRARREWRPAVVAETPVLVSGRTGPAVAGIVRPAVVLPEWALGATPETLELMLAHEREHVRAGDPALLAAAGAAVALMPWNPAAWWQLRRLRLAVEVDCDRRVLRHHPDLGRYGALLLEVGRRGASAADVALPLAALASSRSSLERRIRTMTMRRPRYLLLQSSALAGAAALLVLAACEMPRPTEVAPSGEIPLASIRSEGAYATAEGVTIERVRAAIEQTMPADARAERLGEPHELWFLVGADGKIARTEFLRRARSELRVGEAVIDAPTPSGSIRMRATRVDGVEGNGAPTTAGIAPDAIASIEILKLGPGKVTADPANVVWVQLKPGAKLGTGGTFSTTVAPSRSRRDMSPARSSGGVVAARADSVVLAPSRSGARVVVDGAEPSRLQFRRATGGQAQPLMILDGVPLEASDAASVERRLEAVDPETIESIEVIKGEAARRLYGERGANGVIKVTTKK